MATPKSIRDSKKVSSKKWKKGDISERIASRLKPIISKFMSKIVIEYIVCTKTNGSVQGKTRRIRIPTNTHMFSIKVFVGETYPEGYVLSEIQKRIDASQKMILHELSDTHSIRSEKVSLYTEIVSISKL